MENNLVYLLDGTIYINLTNMCSNNCVFCIRAIKDDVVGTNLFLDSEKVTFEDVKEQLKSFENRLSKEIVFCGYGEPLMKLDLLMEVAEYIKKTYPNIKLRINTNGQANLIHKKDVVPELAKSIDKISVSLNGETKELYEKISVPKLENTYDAVKNFIKECVEYKIETTATIVSGYKDYVVDVERCREIAEGLGAKFRVREWLDNGY